MADKPKFPLTRRRFLQGLGAGIAGLLLPIGKTAKVVAPAAKVIPDMAAQGMPNWFPLLVNRIKSEGKQTRVATGGRSPNNTYKLDDGKGNEYILQEDAISGNIEVYTRGDDFQQVSFEYIPATEMRRPGGKVRKEDGEFHAGEFQKGELEDYENYSLGGVDELKLPINTIEEFAKKGTKTTRQELDELAENFKKATQKEELDFAKGGRVGYKYGGGIGELFKEKRA